MEYYGNPSLLAFMNTAATVVELWNHEKITKEEAIATIQNIEKCFDILRDQTGIESAREYFQDYCYRYLQAAE